MRREAFGQNLKNNLYACWRENWIILHINSSQTQKQKQKWSHWKDFFRLKFETPILLTPTWQWQWQWREIFMGANYKSILSCFHAVIILQLPDLCVGSRTIFLFIEINFFRFDVGSFWLGRKRQLHSFECGVRDLSWSEGFGQVWTVGLKKNSLSN